MDEPWIVGVVKRDKLMGLLSLAMWGGTAIKVRGGISRFEADGVVFEDGRAEKFEAVVLATGFRPDLSRLLPDARSALDASGRPTVSGAAVSEPGLFFCGARTVPTGQLREIALEAPRIAAALI